MKANTPLSPKKKALLKAKQIIRSIRHAGQLKSAENIIVNYNNRFKDNVGTSELKIIFDVEEAFIQVDNLKYKTKCQKNI